MAGSLNHIVTEVGTPIMARCYLDTETAGLHGVPVLLQYAIDDGEVILWELWNNPIQETLELIEKIATYDVVGFNLSFDWFHLYKFYCMLTLLLELYPDGQAFPIDHIEELAIIEEKARFVDICLKPAGSLDVMLIARKTRYQSLMAREPIRIKKIPTVLAHLLADELERRVHFDDIYFANRKVKTDGHWKVLDIHDDSGNVNPNFKDLKLTFAASSSLKNLYRHAFKIKEKFFVYGDIELDKRYWPHEVGYAPFALALAPNAPNDKNWKGTWPDVIREHVLHWSYNKDARTYAANDIIYTRRLAVEHFGNPPANDIDSQLAICVACCRWRGYAVDLERIGQLKYEALRAVGFDEHMAPIFQNSRIGKDTIKKFGKTLMTPKMARHYLLEVLAPEEQIGLAADLKRTTKRQVLEYIANHVDWLNDDGTRHPASLRAREVLAARFAQKEIELYDKIQRAGRFHASFKVIGTLSTRMAGADGLNPQGINHQKKVRRAFTLADQAAFITFEVGDGKITIAVPKAVLCGGDFKSFEVSLAATVFDDPDLTKALLSGIKVHAIMATKLNPGMTYEEALKSEGTSEDWYDKGKKGFFLKCYFGEAYTFNQKLGIPMETAEAADKDFNKQFPGVAKFQSGVKQRFSALTQPGGIGTKVEWKNPDEYVESFLGFRRYFTLEISVMRALFELAQDLPKPWKDLKFKVQRRERIQTASGAVSSALYAAAFSIQGQMIRAAGNHYIQSPGASITKETQANLWALQPVGISHWIVQPMNIHDELMSPTRQGFEPQVEMKAKEIVAKHKEKVKLLAIDWVTGISSWAGKKGDEPEPEKSPRQSLQSVA